MGVGIASLAVAAAFTLKARGRAPGPLWTTANALTCSRCVAAAGLAAQAANRERRLGAWIGLLIGCTLTDWIDGPIARREGPTRLGAILDIEADSWLTLWAAIAAWRSRALPVWCLAAPLLRYLVRLTIAPDRTMATSAWQRAAGALQMAVLCGSLAPMRSLRAAGAWLAPVATLFQLAALAGDAFKDACTM